MARIFIVDGRQLPDPDPRLSVQEVRAQFAQFFPELTNADAREEVRGDDTHITFTRRIGTKGLADAALASPPTGRDARARRPRRRHPDIVAILRRTPERRLRVFDLAAELCQPDGELDLDAAGQREPEINLALIEAETYARATEVAVRAIRALPAR
jgi:PRTRC genetic system protein C